MKETKVYVDELPKSCWECPCFKNNLEFPCGLSDGTQDYFKDEIDGENCPLKSLKIHDRELVKEVCEKIRSELEKELKYDFTSYVPIMNVCNKINRVLDQTQKEYEK